METEKKECPRFRQIVPAWAVGGYGFGLTRGLLHGLSLTESIGIAGHTFLAGALTGAVGGLVVTFLTPSATKK